MMFCLVLLAGCQGEPESASESQLPVTIGDADECHLCGMIINRFPGPKGEAYMHADQPPFKFCSTRELLTFLLQPEHSRQFRAAFVHDMAVSAWHAPDASADAFVDARQAWYVIDHDLPGSMGPTLASFRQREDADRFISSHGGRVLAFEEISLERIARMTATGDHATMHGPHH